MDYEILFLKAVALTIFIETLVLFFLCRFLLRTVKPAIHIILITGILTSSATLPYLWFILPFFIKTNIWYIIIAESFAVLAESLIIKSVMQAKYWKSLAISFLCNMVSFAFGLIIKWP